MPTMPQTASNTARTMRAFQGLLLRDLHVLRREIFPLLVRIAMQPLLFLFVFTYIMPHMSAGANPTSALANSGGGFGTVILPGLMAVAIMFSGIAAVALPLSQEFGITREIDDRVMCPLPVAFVALEKVVFSAFQSLMAAAVVFPLAYYLPATPVQVHVQNWFFLAAVLILASLVSGALGLTIGTSVKPAQIGLIFGVVIMPITFLGCVYYPWQALHFNHWLQRLILINPIVYMSEGLRSALTPGVQHMPNFAIIGMLLVSLTVLSTIGIRGFLRRVIG
jgi:ABC-2 type transport system permease protein